MQVANYSSFNSDQNRAPRYGFAASMEVSERGLQSMRRDLSDPDCPYVICAIGIGLVFTVSVITLIVCSAYSQCSGEQAQMGGMEAAVCPCSKTVYMLSVAGTVVSSVAGIVACKSKNSSDSNETVIFTGSS